MIWQCRTRLIDFSERGMIMGILNTTPDSFSDGGIHDSCERALAHAMAMIDEGAEIIDIGGESTRPGAPAVSLDEELHRVIPVVEGLRNRWQGLISIDTSKASVARLAIAAGADIVNDVSGLQADPTMVDVCRDSGCGVIVMHMQGNPRTMQQSPHYDDVVRQVREFFHERFDTLTNFGLLPQQLCFDPGIGFGKTVEHNWSLLENLPHLMIHDRPLLLGVSRKSFIASRLGNNDLSQRSWPTIALTSFGRERGACIHRVHEVKANLEAMRMTEALLPKACHSH
jgi:dihydropteroate synthase